LKRRATVRGKRKKKEISFERFFHNIMGRDLTKTERIYFGLDLTARPAQRKSSKRK